MDGAGRLKKNDGVEWNELINRFSALLWLTRTRSFFLLCVCITDNGLDLLQVTRFIRRLLDMEGARGL